MGAGVPNIAVRKALTANNAAGVSGALGSAYSVSQGLFSMFAPNVGTPRKVSLRITEVLPCGGV